MLIRPPTESDAIAISSLLGELGYPVEVETVWQRFSPLLIRADYCILLAESDHSSILGLAAAHIIPVVHSDRPVAMITALIVTESARGCGVGKGLVTRLEDFAQDCGCGRIMVTTSTGRSEAHAFYERVGFGFTGKRYVKEVI